MPLCNVWVTPGKDKEGALGRVLQRRYTNKEGESDVNGGEVHEGSEITKTRHTKGIISYLLDPPDEVNLPRRLTIKFRKIDS